MNRRIISRTVLIFSVLFLTLFMFSAPDVKAEIYGTISGKVTAEDTGEGVDGVSVLGLGNWGHNFAKTDKRGVYVLKDLKPGTYMIGFFKGKSPYLFGKPHMKIVLSNGKNVVNANHALKLGGAVSGTVYDADGVTPISRVSVSAEVPNPQPEWVDGSRTKVTDSNGKFLLQGLPESNECIVTVKVRGHARITKTVTITKGQATENVIFVVKWDDPTGITGHVRSTANEPIKNADVILRDTVGNDIGRTLTDDTGKYSITGIAPGTYEVWTFVLWPSMKITEEERVITINAGEQTVVDFSFSDPANNSSWLEQIFASIFVSDAHAVIVSGSGDTYPNPDIRSCDKTKKAIETAFGILTETVNTSSCMSEDIRTKLKEKLGKQVVINCQPYTAPECIITCSNNGSNTVKCTVPVAYTQHDIEAEINLCNAAFKPTKNGCLEASLLHELVHTICYEKERTPSECEKSCFLDCARKSKYTGCCCR